MSESETKINGIKNKEYEYFIPKNAEQYRKTKFPSII